MGKRSFTAALSRTTLAALAIGLASSAPADAVPAGEDVVERTRVPRETFTLTGNFPCLGRPGPEDDAAVISGIRWGQFTLTAAGVTGPEEPIPPYRLHATFHQKITVDPVAEGLPSYRATATLIRRERVTARGEHIMFRQRFKAIADDGSGSFTFHFAVHVFVEPDGTVRFEHVMDKFCSNE